MKILVTGASGFVGGHLCEALLKKGHQVFALVRTPAKLGTLRNEERLTVIQGDLNQSDCPWVHALPADIEACIHTAGLVHSYDTKEFYRVNTEATHHLTSALKEKYPSLHFILLSSLAAAGPGLPGTKRTEEDMDFPISIYGRSKKEGEEALKKSAPSSWTFSIIRPPMVIGPRDPAVLDVYRMVKSGFVLLPGLDSLKKCYSFVCVFDLVETILRTLEYKKPIVLYSAHPQTVTFGELILEIKRQLNKKWLVYLPLPLFLIRWLTFLLAIIYKIVPHSTRLTPDKYHELKVANWTCNGQLSEETLGQVYNYDLKRTVNVTLVDYQNRGWL